MLFSKIKNSLANINSLRLIDIKDNKDCWFQCSHGQSVFYKTPMQILNNQFIIKKLLPHDSCIIGVICGETYSLNLRNGKPLNNFSPSNEQDEDKLKYKLISINRNGSVCYEDCDLEKKSIKIIDLAQDKNIIQNFSSEDSFYIGFLTGIELFKIKNNLNIKPKNKPVLKLVYSRSKVAADIDFNLNGS